MVKKIGPYRVDERLGVGGMGEVYKAFDDRLDRWVAIKRIRPDKEGAEDNRERFQREARSTAKLNHTSIVHLYDIFQEGESDCIVMEYVEGRTLDTMVMEGPLDPALTIRLGLEIASGLAEAHAKGIIHRDLKVENIIITPDGHAKILDFGLAKPILSNELDTSLTGKGQLVGTSRAMSPEYVSGEEIDHRSDLFSLGVLLYEAATGHSPFKAHNTLATLKQVMLHTQTPAAQLYAQVPVELSELIDRLLEKDPEDRPQSSEIVVEAFGQMSQQFSSGAILRPGKASTGMHPAPNLSNFSASATAIEQLVRRTWLWLLVPALIVTIALATWVRQQGGEPLVVPDSGDSAEPNWIVVKREKVVLADFENKTQEALLDDTVGFAFRVGLEQSRYAQVLSQSQVRDVLARMERDPDTRIDIEVGMEICVREGAKALLSGSILKLGDVYQLTGNTIDPATGTKTYSVSETATTQNEIVEALARISEAIRVRLGEDLTQIQDTPSLERVTTKDLRALRSYSLGVASREERQWSEAQRLFLRAIEIDPEFAMAHAKLAAIYLGPERNFVEGRKHIEIALQNSERLTEFEDIYVQGWAARLEGDSEEVVRIWSLMSQLFPESPIGHRNAGLAYYFLYQDYEKAAPLFEKALQVESDTNVLTHLNLVDCLLALGQYEKAFERLAELDRVQGVSTLFDYYLLEEQYDDARTLIEEVANNTYSTPRLEALRWHLLTIDRGQFDRALEEIEELRQRAIQDGQPAVEMSAALIQLVLLERILPEHTASALVAAREEATASGLRLLESELQQLDPSSPLGGLNQVHVPLVALAGKVLARTGDAPRAAMLRDQISKVTSRGGPPIWGTYATMLEAEIRAADGDVAGATRILSAALSSGRDVFQARESMARFYRAAGLSRRAAEEYRWLIDNRGRALIECRFECQAINILDWSQSLYYMSELNRDLGDEQGANRLYDRFVRHRPEGDAARGSIGPRSDDGS